MDYFEKKVLHDQLSEKFNQFVVVDDQPTLNPTHFGELCKAMQLVLNTYLNTFSNPFFGDGCQLCGSEATFLKNESTNEIKSLFEAFEVEAEYFDECNSDYETFLYELLSQVLVLLNLDLNKPKYKEFNSFASEWNQRQCERCNHLFKNADCTHNSNGDLLCYCCKDQDDLEREH